MAIDLHCLWKEILLLLVKEVSAARLILIIQEKKKDDHINRVHHFLVMLLFLTPEIRIPLLQIIIIDVLLIPVTQTIFSNNSPPLGTEEDFNNKILRDRSPMAST